MKVRTTQSGSAIDSLLIAAALLALAAPCCPAQAGAAPMAPAATAAYIPTMTFDVASVRENKNIDARAGFTMSGFFVAHTTTFRAMNWDIGNLISIAYDVHQAQIVAAPKWPWPTLFVIEAKGNSESDAKLASLTGEQQWAEQRHMLRTLLEERFMLKTHIETREGDVYNLVVTKGGSKLGAQGSMPPIPEEKNSNGNPLPPIMQKNDGEGYDFIAHGCTMAAWAEILASQFGRPVIDKTGLMGQYDFKLKYKGRWDQDRPADDLDPTPPMDRALQEQLGIKVEPARGPVTVLVIDRIEKPSEN